MSLDVQIHEVDTHLSIKATGQYSLTNLRALIDRVKEESEYRSKRRAILDVTDVAGTVPVVDTHVLGEHCCRIWKLTVRIAIVSPVGGLNKFFEHVARNKRVQITTVSNQDEAIEWLRRSASFLSWEA